MKEIIAPIISVILLISALSSIAFYLNMANQVTRMMQGDYNATEEFAESVKDEAEEEMKWTVIKALIISVASALGLGGLVAIIKKL